MEDDLWESRSPPAPDLLDDDEPCPFNRLKADVVNLLSPPPVLSEDDIGLAIGPFLSCNLVSPWLLKIILSVLFRYCAAEATDVACSEVAEDSSPETEGKIVLTIRHAGLLLPDDGVIALATGLAELMAGDDEGESFQLDPLP